jgi:hypothetical protein
MPRKNNASPTYPTSIVLTAELKEALQESAQANGRKLAAEIRARLENSVVPGSEQEGLYGFHKENIKRNRALAQLVGLMARNVEATGAFQSFRDSPWTAHALAAGLSGLFDRLASTEGIAPEERKRAQETGRIIAGALFDQLKTAHRIASEGHDTGITDIAVLADIYEALQMGRKKGGNDG